MNPIPMILYLIAGLIVTVFTVAFAITVLHSRIETLEAKVVSLETNVLILQQLLDLE